MAVLLGIIIIGVVVFGFFYLITFYFGLFGAIFNSIKGRIEEKNELAQLPEAKRNAIIEKKKQERRKKLRKELSIIGITVAVTTIIGIIAVGGDLSPGFWWIVSTLDVIVGFGSWFVARSV